MEISEKSNFLEELRKFREEFSEKYWGKPELLLKDLKKHRVKPVRTKKKKKAT